MSAVIVGLAMLLLWVVKTQGNVSPPGEVGKRAAEWSAVMAVEPAGLATWMIEPTEPGPMYRYAIDSYEAERYELRRVQVTSTNSAGAEQWKRILQPIMAAAKSSRPVVFGGNAGDVINYDPERPKLEAMRAIGKMAVHIALLHGVEGNVEQKRQYLEVAFALGAKLYSERLTYGEYSVATELLGDASRELGELAEKSGDVGRAAALREFNRARLESYKKQIEPVQRAIMVLEPNPGDAFALAERASEAMWRIEAILALGRLKYSAERNGDKQGAVRVIDQFCTSGDPRIKAAAVAAKTLAVEEFRKLR
jgi:hypothetical protein